MRWKIYNISIPVKNINDTKNFYKLIFGETFIEDKNSINYFKYEEDQYFGINNFGIRFFKPKPDLELINKIQSRRSFISLLVEDIELIKNNLIKSHVKFLSIENKKSYSILVQEPSLNLLHIVQDEKKFLSDIDGFYFGYEWGIHHMNLESLDVRESINFFTDILNLKEGEWFAPKNKGDFSLNKTDLSIIPSSTDNKGIHIIKPDDGFGYRNNFAHNPSISGHPAFTVKNIDEVMYKLGKRKILYSDARVYAMPGYHQIYLYDLNANMVEINQSI